MGFGKASTQKHCKKKLFSIQGITWKLKLKITQSIINGYACFVNLLRKIKNTKPSVLILPPASEGSIGDEALISSIIHYLHDERDIKRVGLVKHKNADTWERVGKLAELISIENFVRYRSLKNGLKFVQAVQRHSHFYVIGADTLDGFFSEAQSLLLIELANLAYRAGSKTSIINFSFNLTPKESCAAALKNLSPNIQLIARGMLSQQRLQSHINRNIGVGTDVAFLLKPDMNSKDIEPIRRWINDQKKAGKIVIGINASYTSFQRFPEITISQIISIYVKIIQALGSKVKRITFLLIPHDSRSEWNDMKIAHAIFSRLPKGIKAETRIFDKLYSASEIKAACEGLNCMFTGRLHLAIAGLSQGVPAITVGYQDKAQEIYKNFDLETALVVEPTTVLDIATIVFRLEMLIAKSDEFRTKINSKLSDVKKLAEANFQTI